MDITLLFCVILSFFAFYYFNKFQESEKSFYALHVENTAMKTRINDLLLYQNDVSKTFKILDNELGIISNHISTKNAETQTQTQYPSRNARVSIITPSIIESLFSSHFRTPPNTLIQENTQENNIQESQEIREELPTIREETREELQGEIQEELPQHESSTYDKLLI